MTGVLETQGWNVLWGSQMSRTVAHDVAKRMENGPTCNSAATDAETLYLSQGRELWALFYSRCCDAELALDAVQEAMLRLCEHQGAPIRDVRRWVLRVGRNWLSDVLLRRRHAGPSIPNLDGLVGGSPEPSSLSSAAERQMQVREALAQLRVADRELLVLRYALDWDSKRIAQHLGTTATAIDMRLSRARRRCAQALHAVGVTDETL